MPEDVKAQPPRRPYRSPARAAQAAATRRAVLAAARDLFTTRGYGVAVTEIADRAGVSLDTVYAGVGRKPELVLAVIDMVLGSADEPLPAEERPYVRAVLAAPTAAAKLRTYAAALASLYPSVAPLQEALRQAGLTDPGCAAAHTRLVERRARNMLLLAADLRATGEVRPDLADRWVADVVWSTGSAEHFLLLTSRGWTPQEFGEHLADLWTRVLLRRGAGDRAGPGVDRAAVARPALR